MQRLIPAPDKAAGRDQAKRLLLAELLHHAMGVMSNSPMMKRAKEQPWAEQCVSRTKKPNTPINTAATIAAISALQFVLFMSLSELGCGGSPFYHCLLFLAILFYGSTG